MPENKWIVWIIAAVFAFNLLGGLMLAQKQEGIRGDTGRIWNQVDTCAEKLNDLSAQVVHLEGYYADEVLNQITDARSAYKVAAEEGNLEGAIGALGQADRAVNVVLENYPEVGLAEVEVGVFDETAGCYNRISYARDQLIQSQQSYNQTRLIFFPTGLVFDRQEILGEYSDPTDVDLPSRFNE